MKGGEIMDPRPLLDWIDAHPGCVAGWGEMGGERGAAARRLSAMRRGAETSFHMIDSICCLLHVHMAVIYGAAYWTARCDDLDTCPDCGGRKSEDAERCMPCSADLRYGRERAGRLAA